jgi:hypothetical protein
MIFFCFESKIRITVAVDEFAVHETHVFFWGRNVWFNKKKLS